MQKTKQTLLEGKRSGIIKSFQLDDVNGEIFATAYYNGGEVNMCTYEGKHVVYDPINGKTAVYGKYDTIGKAVHSMLRGSWKCGRRTKVLI